MTARDYFRRMIFERRQYRVGSLDWQWRTEAARKYLLIMRGVPTTEWAGILRHWNGPKTEMRMAAE